MRKASQISYLKMANLTKFGHFCHIFTDFIQNIINIHFFLTYPTQDTSAHQVCSKKLKKIFSFPFFFFLILIKNHKISVQAHFTVGAPPGGWNLPNTLPNQPSYISCTQLRLNSCLMEGFSTDLQFLKLVGIFAIFAILNLHLPPTYPLSLAPRSDWAYSRGLFGFISLNKHVSQSKS